MEILKKCAESLITLRQKQPLIHHITNYVTVNDCANIVLAVGASPVMADDSKEVEDIVSLAQALVINMGTLNQRTVESMLKAGKRANELKIPVIFDPVGMGASSFRNETAKKIIAGVKLAVIRGNMSEIKLIAGQDVKIKGVDSLASEEDGTQVAQGLARKLKTVVAITGKTDIISDGTRTCYINNGHERLSHVTGTGCMATSLIGSFCGAVDDYYLASLSGVMAMGLAGELASESLSPAEGIGTFRIRLFDNISNLSQEMILKRGRVSYE